MAKADPIQFDAALTTILACPACHGQIRQTQKNLVCEACGRSYPIIDGIPVLIADRAEQLSAPPDH
jgi:uncharacterized protein YbaR (Trm112 family)